MRSGIVPGGMIGLLPFLSKIQTRVSLWIFERNGRSPIMPPGTIPERMIGLLPFLSKIQSDTRVWLRTAYEHVSGSGPLQRLRVINNQSANQTSHAGMTDSSPARPSDRNVARFREFKQASEFRIPSGGHPATRERNCGARSGRPLWRVRSVNNLCHTRGNGLERTKNFRVHILSEYTPGSQPIAHVLQE